MKIFELETPIRDKIKKIVEDQQTAGNIPADDTLLFLDYEPDENFLGVDLDGAIAVYGSGIDFSESSGSGTERQEGDSRLTVDAYGFGDPVEKSELTPADRFSTVREAQIRAELLITLAYRAIMDRRELKGAPNEGIEKDYGTNLDLGADKFPVSLQKFTPVGTMNSKRGVCIYRFIFKFRMEEKSIDEALGVSYQGLDNFTSDTYNPGDEPEGV